MHIITRRFFIRSSLIVFSTGLVLKICHSSENTINKNQARAAIDVLNAKQLSFSQGKLEAPIVMQEFLSLTCTHCADFHVRIYPEIKKKFIDSGELLLVYRHFPLDAMALRAHTLVHSLPSLIGLKLQNLLLTQQSTWINQEGNLDNLNELARLTGLSLQQIKKAYNNKSLINQIIAERQKATLDYGINGTPAFVIGSEKFPDENYKSICDWIQNYL